MTRVSPRMLLRSVAAAALVLLALSGCTPNPEEPTVEPSPSAEPEQPTEPAVPVFVAPTSCTELLGSELEQDFLAESVLFSDSAGNGINPGEPIGQDGGDPFACLYGQDGVDLSTFELSAQALSNEEHEGVIAELATRGLDEQSDGERVSFSQEGSEGGDPAILHVVYPDGWITAYSTFGGAERSAEIASWVETATSEVYPAP